MTQERAPFTHDPSATAAFAALPTIDPGEVPEKGLRAIVIGGGTGAPVSIRTLLSMELATDAVVAMADDGGSTGILRAEADATAPGDIRKCITAMAADAADPLTQAFKIRFTFAEGHTLGNLMLSALEETAGGFPEAIRICERLLNARGHVYPSTLNRVTLTAVTREGHALEGQAVACHSRVALESVALHAPSGIAAYEPALAAIRAADLIVLGPGSLFTSIIPNLLVPGVVEAVRQSAGTTVFVCSLADMQGETRGMTAREHYEALCRHGMAGVVDYMLVHAPESALSSDVRGGLYDGMVGSPARSASSSYGFSDSGDARVRPVGITRADIAAIEKQGTRVIARDLVDNTHPTWHDPAKLRRAFLEVLKLCRSPRM